MSSFILGTVLIVLGVIKICVIFIIPCALVKGRHMDRKLMGAVAIAIGLATLVEVGLATGITVYQNILVIPGVVEIQAEILRPPVLHVQPRPRHLQRAGLQPQLRRRARRLAPPPLERTGESRQQPESPPALCLRSNRS